MEYTNKLHKGFVHKALLTLKHMALSAALTTLPVGFATAAENIDTGAVGDTVIADQLWVDSAFPFTWFMNQNGVTNNDSNGLGTPAVSNANAQNELIAAFQVWEAVPTASITANYGGTTATADIGCDLENIVSWDDSVIAFPAGVIAIGFGFSYIGADMVLNNANRDIGCGPLDNAIYPNGSVLESGTIVDADMIWNDSEFDYSMTANATGNVFDIRAVAAHEFGHLFGISHTSLAFLGTDPATMFPAVSDTSIAWQNNVRTLAADDDMAAGRSYPGVGYFPTGSVPWVTGSVTGRVRQIDGSAASGVRLWAYDASSPFDSSAPPVYEAFTATDIDTEAGVSAGDYSFRGMPPGEYYICIVPWGVNVPNSQVDDPIRYNATTSNGAGNSGFPTECYDDAASGTASPDFSEIDRLRTVTVGVGEETPNINFVTQAQDADVVLVMDRSGSMNSISTSPVPGTSKLDALKYAANVFLDFLELDAGHRVGLAQFEEVVVPLAPAFDLQSITAASIVNANAAINNMIAGGWTNIIDGAQEGANQLTSVASPSDRQLMLLLSDGKHNRPLGSDINDIAAPILANDITLYSVGFGADVNDVELSPIALSSGGLHINNADVSDLQLRKHFLSVAASAADSTTLIDPHYDLGYGEVATLEVPVLSSERSVTFAVLWSDPNPNLFDITLVTPSGCTIYTHLNKKGVQVRKGDTHRLVEVTMPYLCKFRQDHRGTWKVNVANKKESKRQEKVSVDIAVYGDSRTHIFADAKMIHDEYPGIQAKIVSEGELIKEAKFTAEIIMAAYPTGDSEELDYYCTEQAKDNFKCRQQEVKPSLRERTTFIDLNDDGTGLDKKGGDGVFTAQLPAELLGSYQVRVIADYADKDGKGKREIYTSYQFDGKQINSKLK